MGEAKRRKQLGQTPRGHGVRDWQRLNIPKATLKACIHMDQGDSGDIAFSPPSLVEVFQTYDRKLPIRSHQDAVKAMSGSRQILRMVSIDTDRWGKAASMLLWAALRRGLADEYDQVIENLEHFGVFAYYIAAVPSPDGVKILTFGMEDVVSEQELPAILAEQEQIWDSMRVKH